jgi:hypothetical protein
MMAGWEYSAGSALEIQRALIHGMPVQDLEGRPISRERAANQLLAAAADLATDDVPINGIESAANALRKEREELGLSLVARVNLRKDEALDRLADWINVAQFVSFSPNGQSPRQQYARVHGLPANYHFPSINDALATLLERSVETSINLRSYYPHDPRNREFIYGIRSVEDAVSAARRLASEGLHVIANETVDIHDGGVSGVLLGNVIEFAPDDTPRCVEKPGTASLPRDWGIGVLTVVYGFVPELTVPRDSRLEFSIHPKPRGWRHSHTLAWEFERTDRIEVEPKLSWPNAFSRLIGDKVFGLLLAHQAGLPVPRTTVINRRVAPFTFGQPTSTAEFWLRTSPTVQVPGRFTTSHGWTDPFAVMHREDPDAVLLASIISQEAIPSKYSGAAIVMGRGELHIEGVSGEGERLMRGSASPEVLPQKVCQDVTILFDRAKRLFGPVRFEWVHDGHQAWIVQLHRGQTRSTAEAIVPGEAARWVRFDTKEGLEALRILLSGLSKNSGLLLSGDIGLTSHIADVIRRAGLPARIESKESA